MTTQVAGHRHGPNWFRAGCCGADRSTTRRYSTRLGDEATTSSCAWLGQNRQAAFQQAKADHDFETEELEPKTNTELTRQIHTLTEELHRRIIGVASTRHDSAQEPPV
jgi:hypothetical protein